MTINDCIDYCSRELLKSDILSSRLDTLIIVEDVIEKDRAWIIAHPEHELTSSQIKQIESQVKRRAQHEPLAYIRGKSEFYGRKFLVNEHTLEPRPETETMIELFKEIITAHNNLQVVDLGTGSGCIAITLSLELPRIKVLATDVDAKCITAARNNQEILKSSVDFRQGNLLEPVENILDRNYIVVTNLPYVPDGHTINRAAMFEPKHAIFGGEDGLDLYREMFAQITEMEAKPKYIFTESLPFQHKELAKIAQSVAYQQIQEEDFIQILVLS